MYHRTVDRLLTSIFKFCMIQERPVKKMMHDFINMTTNQMNSTVATVDHSHTFSTTALIFDTYLVPIITICGIICNFLIILTLKDKIFQQYPVRVYFTSIAVTDSFALLLNCTKQMFKYHYGQPIMKIHTVCHLFKFCHEFFVGCSAWLVVAVGVERALAVTYPVQAKVWDTISLAKKVTIITCVMLAVVESHHLWMADFSSDKCVYHAVFMEYKGNVVSSLDLVLSSILPVIIVCICYIILSIKVIQIF